MSEKRKTAADRILSFFMDYFGMDRRATLVAMALPALVVEFACFRFFHSAPPRTITIASGDPGSSCYKIARQYAAVPARDGVTLKIPTSAGSAENLRPLTDPSFKVDIGFFRAGLAGEALQNK